MDQDTLSSLIAPGSIREGCVLGRYELLMPIAAGGMAIVWAARLRGSRGFQKIVAIKTIRPEMSADLSFEAMLLDEASLASRIRHPQVVEILDLGDENGVPYIVMEWIDGESLLVLMREASASGGIPLPLCVRLATQLCAGLHAAHELRNDDGELVGLVHRDVSPQNVLVTRDGVAKLVDFGIAKAIGRAAGETMAGKVKGKTAYLAPEQARGNAADRRSDIFATGALLYAMTTGKHPFRGVNDFETLTNLVADKPPPRPGKFVPGFPPQLEKVIMTALEKDPARRFQTANEMLRELDHSLPSNKRISTDEEVAAFIRPLVGNRFDAMRARIKEALRAADDRLAGVDPRKTFTTEAVEAFVDVRKAVAAGLDTPSREGTGSGRLSAVPDPEEARRALSGVVGRLRGESGEPAADNREENSVPQPVDTESVVSQTGIPNRRRRLGVAALAAVTVACIAVGVVAIAARPSKVPSAELTSARSAGPDSTPSGLDSRASALPPGDSSPAPASSSVAAAASDSAAVASPSAAASASARPGKPQAKPPRYTPKTI